MLARMLSTDPVIKQEPLSLKNCSTLLQDARQTMENKTMTIYTTAMNNVPCSQTIPASTTWEDGVQLQSAGIVHQYLQYYPQWKRESIRNSVSNAVKVQSHSDSTSSGVERCDYRTIPPEKIKREKIGKAIVLLLSLMILSIAKCIHHS